MAEDDVDGQHLIGTACGQAVGAGQIDDLDGLAVKVEFALLGFDGDAGIIADLLLHPGQGVEESGFAGVGVADQGNQRSAQCNHGSLSGGVGVVSWVNAWRMFHRVPSEPTDHVLTLAANGTTHHSPRNHSPLDRSQFSQANLNPGGLAASQTQAEILQPNLNRIAHRSETDHFDDGSFQKSHFVKTLHDAVLTVDSFDAGGLSRL